MITLTEDSIDTAGIVASVQSARAGAVVLFLGLTRELTGSRKTRWLDYECYRKMAQSTLEQLEADARDRWKLTDCVIVHRLGRVDLAEASVAVAVASPHRTAAFEAARWIMDRLKESVPIWKKENWSDGSSEWVHPGLESTPKP